MLEIRDLTVSYGRHRALGGVSATVEKGEIVVVLGANGAGKSTLLRAISGLCEGEVGGDVRFVDMTLSGLEPDQIVEAGIALVPEGRGIFGDLTVRENLALGAYSARARPREKENLNRVLALFPKLRERAGQIARTMSGGEQQMVAIGRAMMSEPEILMLDEPSLGLSPLLCKELFQNLKRVREAGIGVLLVEQNARQSLAIADRGYLLENGEITGADTAAAMLTDPAVQAAYLGGGGSTTKTSSRTDTQVAKPIRPRSGMSSGSAATTEALAGASIHDLVSRATATQSEDVTARRRAAMPLPSTPNKPEIPRSSDANTRVRDLLQEMEQAAAAARNPSVPPTSPATPDARSGVRKMPEPGRNARRPMPEPAPVIEVYRRPRVEVYRRCDGGFDQN